MKKYIYFLFVIICAVVVTGCNNTDDEKEEKVLDKYEKVSNYLVENGWKKNEKD